MKIFQATDILIPQLKSMEQWAVIACDQYTSQPEYWDRVEENAKGAKSTLNLILPEARMDQTEELIPRIHQNMENYLSEQLFTEYPSSYIYIERTLVNGMIRRGVVGAVDLDMYDYAADTDAAIRATERTVEERIPPRMNIRRGAAIELSHVLLLCDDQKDLLLGTLQSEKCNLPKLYDFDLMEDGGHITGWLVAGEQAEVFEEKLDQYVKEAEYPMIFAVGDGNHSLATAKACYEEMKKTDPSKDWSNHPARYALVELENIHDASQEFEPIHRIVCGTDADALVQAMKEKICAEEGYPLICYIGNKEETLYLNPELGELAVAIVQEFLDDYLTDKEGIIDYIHGEDVVRDLAQKEKTIGLVLPEIKKGQFFKGIVKDGVLPRKTFSMGHAQEKRYYLEGRKIR